MPVAPKQAATLPIAVSMRCSASWLKFWMTATGSCASTAASAVQPSSLTSAFWIASCACFSLSVQKTVNRHEWWDMASRSSQSRSRSLPTLSALSRVPARRPGLQDGHSHVTSQVLQGRAGIQGCLICHLEYRDDCCSGRVNRLRR